MKIIKKLTEKELYINQVIFLVECNCGHNFECDELLRKNWTKNTGAICPECGEDSSDIVQLNITC